jgi:tubulin-specific chaperone A
MSDQTLRNLKIKTNVVKRLKKDLEVSNKEVAVQQGRIEKLQAEGGDEYTVRKQIEVLEECKMIIPDTQRRLEEAMADLGMLLESPTDDVKMSAEYKDAQAILA